MATEGPGGGYGGLQVVLAGNIASGKSTLARGLADRLGLALIEESVGDNPYLDRFYADMPRWAFHLNMYFLGSRSQAILDATTSGRGGVFDRSLYEDRLFVDLARADGITPEDNYAVFRSLYDVLERVLPPPSILIYLEAPTDVLRRRITARGRAFEQELTVEYLDRIQGAYRDWVSTFDRCPVLRVDAEANDYRTDERSLELLYKQVQRRLGSATG
ncbi:deoxynucleoside kinase [Nocardioides sp. NPDC127503]|uniref:deoxynucleoside kinase n=1 Tax=Nocardioides sp. NPDC127503 TaxID=3154516 RepID=UPI00332A7238